MKIKDKEYKVKYTLRALLIFEQITGRSFAMNGITDLCVFMFSVLLANNPDMDLTFNELMDIIDEDESIVNEFMKFLNKEKNKHNIFNTDEKEDKKKV